MTLILSGTDGLSDVDGSAATPAIRGTDTNTGIFFPAADTIAFSEGGTEAMRLDSGGNMGLGVTPSAWYTGYKAFQLTGDIGFASTGGALRFNNYLNAGASADIYYGNGWAGRYRFTLGNHIWDTAASGTAGGTVSFTQAMTLDASGDLTVPSKIFAGQYQGDGTNDFVVMSNNASKPIVFYTGVGGVSAVERARIDSSGNLLVGTTTSAAKCTFENPTSGGISVAANFNGTNSVGYWGRYGSASGTAYFGWWYYNNSQVGAITSTGSTTVYGTTSDYRLKENVQPMQNALAAVAQLKPCTYTWKSTGEQSQGFIAHELAEVVPDCVVGEKDAVDADGNPVYQGIDTSFLVATLTAALQELKALVDTQASTITALQADVASLQAPQGTP